MIMRQDIQLGILFTLSSSQVCPAVVICAVIQFAEIIGMKLREPEIKSLDPPGKIFMLS